MPFHRLYFNLIRLLCPAKPAMTKSKKLFFDTCDVISDLQTKFCWIFGKFKSGAIKCHFRIENRPSILADSTGAETPPPPSAGRVRKYSIGARFNSWSGVSTGASKRSGFVARQVTWRASYSVAPNWRKLVAQVKTHSLGRVAADRSDRRPHPAPRCVPG